MMYDIVETYEAGIVLQWHEVKSIKAGNCNIKDAIVVLDQKKLVVVNMDVALYEKTSPRIVWDYQPKHKRELLVKKAELGKIASKTIKTGLAMIPLQVYITTTGMIKATIWIGKLRKKVEKKSIIKERDIKREMERETKMLKA